MYKQIQSEQGVGKVYYNKGLIYRQILEYDKAEVNYNIALSIFKKNSNLKFLSKTYNNLGLIYFETKKFNKAKDLFLRSLSIKKKEDSSGLHFPYLNLARTYSRLNDKKKAKHYFNLAINNIRNYSHDKKELASIYQSYAIHHGSTGNIRAAEKYFSMALNLFYTAYGKKNITTSKCLLTVSKFYFENNQFKKSLAFVQKSINAVCKIYSDTCSLNTPPISQSADDIQMFKALSFKAKILAADENDLEKLKTCFVSSQKAVKLLQKINLKYQSHQIQQFLLGAEKNIYYTAAHTAAALYKKTANNYYKNFVFKYSELSKSGILSATVRNIELIADAGIKDSILSKEAEYKRKIAWYKRSGKSGSNSKDSISMFYTTYFEQKLENLKQSMQKNIPGLYELKYNESVLNISDYQNKLDDSFAVIEYLLPDKNSKATPNEMIIVVITKGITKHYTVPVDKTFYLQIERLRMFLSENYKDDRNKEFDIYKYAAHYLYSKLIEPYKELLENKSIIVIPDKELAYIPFETLLTERVNDLVPDYRKLPYLIKKTPISYSFALNILYSKYYSKSAHPNNMLAFAPSFRDIDKRELNKYASDFYNENKSYLKQLPFTSQSVSEIINITGGKQLTEEKATERAMKELAGEFTTLLFSTHTIINQINPLYSGLVFNLNNDADEDGILYTYELNNMRVKADLAILDACDTGNGKYIDGEGIISIARGFKYAGARSIIMSLFNVKDIQSASLMYDFVENINSGELKNISLQQAKIKHIATSDNLEAHPHYWAGFIHIGNVNPVPKTTANKVIYFLLILAVSTAFLIFLMRNKILFQIK